MAFTWGVIVSMRVDMWDEAHNLDKECDFVHEVYICDEAHLLEIVFMRFNIWDEALGDDMKCGRFHKV